MSKEAMKLAREALIAATPVKAKDPYMQAAALVALEEALAKLAEQPAQQEPFGYFKAEPFGWTDCAETDEGAIALYTTPQAQPAVCTWVRPDSGHMPDTWEASCGAMWTFTEGGPKDNDLHFCPKCGKPAIEAAHGTKGNT